MSGSYNNKVVLVTGANSGIGEAIAVMFEKFGAKVIGVTRRQEALEGGKKRHPGMHWVLADVSDEKQTTLAVESAAKQMGRLDVVVNNAAVFMLAPLEHSDGTILRTQFETNVFGVAYVSRAALPFLKESRGSIVNISSGAGHIAAPGAAVYGATKAAVESLTLSWALELAPHGVRVNAVAPGPTETAVFEKAVPVEMVAAVKASFLQKVPLGRMGHVDEVARWVVQVADPEVTWLTGQVLSIDGGMSLT